MFITFLTRSRMYAAAVFMALLLAWTPLAHSSAEDILVIPEHVVPDLSNPQKLELVSGHSVVLRSPKELSRISEPDSEVAEALLLSPQEVYLTPKAAGTTNLILWQDKKVVAVYEMKVVYELSRLKERINELFPEERELRIMSTHDSITLSGRVSSSSSMDQILALTESFAPRDKIRNLVQVGGVHQVMLEVKVAEMNRRVGKELGINFGYFRGDDFGVTTLGGLSSLNWDGAPYDAFPDEFSISDSVNALLRFDVGSVTWTGFLNALQRDGLAKVLAEPSLISLSGRTASFLAGGEFPVPEVDRDGNVGVNFRPYGVELAFTPTVLDKDRIAIEVVPVVSELDRASGTQIAGAFVPGMRVRKASTTVELGDGQSFAIAGLLSETSEEVLSKFPGLGDLPVLGSLFSSKEFRSNETELVIMVTPRLVRPVVAERQPMPTDAYIRPDDAEFYLWGVFGKSHEHMAPRGAAAFDGEFGHVIVR